MKAENLNNANKRINAIELNGTGNGLTNPSPYQE